MNATRGLFESIIEAQKSAYGQADDYQGFSEWLDEQYPAADESLETRVAA